MLTKTRKWSIIVLLLLALVMAGCSDPKPVVKEKVTPTAIEIEAYSYVGTSEQMGVLIGGDPMVLGIKVEPEDGDPAVTWSSSDTSIATVDENGYVTGLKGGNVKIRAVSTKDDTIKAEINITVFESLDQMEVLLNAMNYIKESIPKYISADYKFPTYDNKLVTIEYFDTNGNKFMNGLFKYNYTIDEIQAIKAKVNYLGVSGEVNFEIRIVADQEHNEFEAIKAAKANVEEFLKTYKDDKLKETISSLPTAYTFGEGEDAIDVAISWTTASNNLTITEVQDEDGVVTRVEATFSRPNDDTVATLETYFACENVSEVARHKVTLNGYTKEEKIAWLKENVLPKVTELQAKNLNLPTTDSKYNTTITWASSDEASLSNIGRINPYLDAEKTVTLTATITYTSSTEGATFTEDVVLPILVKPAANDAEKVALDFSNRIADDETFPTYFPYGLKSREGNTLPLPTKVGGDSQYKDVEVVWTCSEEGLFSETWELQKQYLKYHEITLTFTVTVGDNSATGEVIINVGITEFRNTKYIGGRFIAAKDLTEDQPFDSLNTISRDDGAEAGSSYEGWSGYTYYIDVTDETTGVVTRYQYFADKKYTYKIFEGEGGISYDEDGNMIGNIKGMTGDVHANYQYMFMVNTTDKDVQIPISYLNYKGSSVTKDINGNNLIRQVSVAFDGWRIAFAADKDGKVTFGFGATNIETGLIEAADKDEEGNYTLPEYVTIPAGGFGWSPFTNQNNTALGIFCEVGAEITLLEYTPKY